MKHIVAPLLLLLSIALNLLSCDGLDENYSTNPNHQLSFSMDTLSFDTVFTTIGSATKEFMVYNRNSEPLLIGEVMLASGEESGFRINVDGRRGDYFQDLRIAANDSMYVFVEVTVDPNESNQPLLIADSVLFTTNGVRQSVRLEAYGQNVNLYRHGLTLTQDTLLTAERPYLIYDSLVIAPEATLRIEPGAIFYMHDAANILVHGTLLAEGTREQPILFRGDRLDFILNDVLPYDRTPSQWGGIFFSAESSDYQHGRKHLLCLQLPHRGLEYGADKRRWRCRHPKRRELSIYPLHIGQLHDAAKTDNALPNDVEQ